MRYARLRRAINQHVGGVRATSAIAFEQPLFQLFDATFQLLQLLAHRRHAANVSVQPFVFIKRLNRDAPPHTGADNLPRQNARLRSDDRAALHANMITESDLPANHAIVFDCDAATDSRLRGDDDALADIAVVPDVNHVIELCSTAYSRA